VRYLEIWRETWKKEIEMGVIEREREREREKERLPACTVAPQLDRGWPTPPPS